MWFSRVCPSISYSILWNIVLENWCRYFLGFVSLPQFSANSSSTTTWRQEQNLKRSGREWASVHMPLIRKDAGLPPARRVAHVRDIRWWCSCVSVSLSFKIFFHLTFYWRTYFTFSCSIHVLANDHLVMTHTTTSPCSVRQRMEGAIVWLKQVRARPPSLFILSVSLSSYPFLPISSRLIFASHSLLSRRSSRPAAPRALSSPIILWPMPVFLPHYIPSLISSISPHYVAKIAFGF
jgi:hypothetical protein